MTQQHRQPHGNSRFHSLQIGTSVLSNRRCGEMADAQDLKMKNWPFLPFSFLFSLYNVSIVFIGQNSLFACPYNVPLSKAKSGTKSGTRTQEFRSHTKLFAAMKWHTVAQIFLRIIYALRDGVL